MLSHLIYSRLFKQADERVEILWAATQAGMADSQSSTSSMEDTFVETTALVQQLQQEEHIERVLGDGLVGQYRLQV